MNDIAQEVAPNDIAPSDIVPKLELLATRIDRCMLADRVRFRRRLARTRRDARRAARGKGGPAARLVERLRELERAVERSCSLREQRALPRAPIEFDSALPISAHLDLLRDAISANQVVIVCAETGSGKSTQIPKLLLQMDRGVEASIVQTQPRRVAARSVANRVSAELGESIGETVGFKVRFSQSIGRQSRVQIVTDGLLLAEIDRDPMLLAYDTVILDEAHERSLNVDFLLGYMHTLLAKRPDLKLIVSSATLEIARLSAFFQGAAVVDVPGRSYPVEVRYQPPEEAAEVLDLAHSCVHELLREDDGDILVFLSGEREIHDLSRRLRGALSERSVAVLPLYARLPAAQQDRVFRLPEQAIRRVILATNVAETSLTVPGIRYVVDPGFARVARSSARHPVERLPVERISQASARQRAGRCGRTGPGVCVRLYSEEDFVSRPEHEDPEIKRKDLASVLLRLRALGFADVERFPFVDAPDRRRVSDAAKLLAELGALDEADQLTAIGRQLAALPVDPRIGRMLLAAQELDCLQSVLIIAAALCVQDPRERPVEARARADLSHQRYRDERSDFISYINLWEQYRAQARARSRSELREWCRKRFLNVARLEEWREVHLQLAMMLREANSSRRAPRNSVQEQSRHDYARIHRALLFGLLRQIGNRAAANEYAGLRDVRFQIGRGSSQFSRVPKWIVAAGLVETERRYAHCVAAVRPTWIERAAQPLLRRSYFEAHWDARRGEAMVFEQTNLHGLVLSPRRRVRYSPLSRDGARELFIRFALLDAGLVSNAPFLAHNRDLVARLRALEARLRRPVLLGDEQSLIDFYDEALDPRVLDRASFEGWWRRLDKATLKRLHLNEKELLKDDAPVVDEQAFPANLTLAQALLPIQYRFEPGRAQDGISVRVPVEGLAQLDARRLDWLVPGLLSEKVAALLRGLPKRIRRRVGPSADAARAFVEQLDDRVRERESLELCLRTFLRFRFDVEVPADCWTESHLAQVLPDYLRVRIEVVDDEAEVIASGRDIAALRSRFWVDAKVEPEQDIAAPDEYRCWAFGEVQRQTMIERAGARIVFYPALTDTGSGVRLIDTISATLADAISKDGLLRLFFLHTGITADRLPRDLAADLELSWLGTQLVEHPQRAQFGERVAGEPTIGGGHRRRRLFPESLIWLAGAQAMQPDWPTMRDEAAFEAAAERANSCFESVLRSTCALAVELMRRSRDLNQALGDDALPRGYAKSICDMREQLNWLINAETFFTIDPEQLSDLGRYLQALELRLHKLLRGGARDGDKLEQISPHWARYVVRAGEHRKAGRHDSSLHAYRWLLEEYRISLFAQEIGTASRVSKERLNRLWDSISA